MYFSKRWYDKEPRMSLAVECLKQASPLMRKKIAQIIIRKAKSFNVKIEEQPFVFFRRWYDEDKTLRLAMEYFRVAPPNIKKIITELIITSISTKTPNSVTYNL